MEKTWDDQPDEIKGTTIVVTLRLEMRKSNVIVEVRKRDDDTWYITAGHLFGSQTIKVVGTAEKVLTLLGTMSGAKNALPVEQFGVELLEA